MDDADIKKKIAMGGVLAQVSFEVIGNPKEHIEKAIKDFIANIKKDSRVHIISEDFGEAEPVEGGLWSTYADTEIVFDNLEKVVWLCINFMPASFEIISPEELRIKDKQLTDWITDLLAKLHEVSHTARQASIKDDLLVKSMNALIQNAVLLAAEQYHEPVKIGKKIGMEEDKVKPFIEALVKQGRLEEKKGSYYVKGADISVSKKVKKKHGVKKRD